MDPADMELSQLHGINKIPQQLGWWKFQDLLERQIYPLSMEFLCKSIRHLSVSRRSTWQNFYGSAWLRASAFQTWVEAWRWVPQSGKSNFLKRTSAIDESFAWNMLDAVYRTKTSSTGDLESLD